MTIVTDESLRIPHVHVKGIKQSVLSSVCHSQMLTSIGICVTHKRIITNKSEVSKSLLSELRITQHGPQVGISAIQKISGKISLNI